MQNFCEKFFKICKNFEKIKNYFVIEIIKIPVIIENFFKKSILFLYKNFEKISFEMQP